MPIIEIWFEFDTSKLLTGLKDVNNVPLSYAPCWAYRTLQDNQTIFPLLGGSGSNYATYYLADDFNIILP